MTGLLCGLIRMGLEWSVSPPDCGSGEENKQFEVVSSVSHYSERWASDKNVGNKTNIQFNGNGTV